MIYEAPTTTAPLSQGDILDECPLVYWTAERDAGGDLNLQIASSAERQSSRTAAGSERELQR